jgi:CRP/FNR family transcriptional regulator, cyclic AMP receptor protein
MSTTSTGPDPSPDLVASISLYGACNPDERRRLHALTTEVAARAGQVLCREGETGEEVFVVIEGEAEVSIGGAGIVTLGPGDVFGELALLDGGPRVATVAALSPIRLRVLTRTRFHTLVADAPAVGLKVLHAVGARVRAAAACGRPVV